MKRMLKYHFYVLRCHTLLLSVLLAVLLLAAVDSGYNVLQYSSRTHQSLNSVSALAYAFEGRRVMGLIGALWGCVFVGYDFAHRGINEAIYRAMPRRSIFLSKYLLLLLCCIAGSLIVQFISLVIAWEGSVDISASWLLRCAGLRLMLDLSVMLTPVVVIFALKETMPTFLICMAYGLLIYFKAKTNYSLWLPGQMYIGIDKLWSLAACPVSFITSYYIWIRAELR